MSKSWFTVAKSGDDAGKISIFSDIGSWGVSASDFRRELDALGDVSEIALAIGSNGGDVFTGFAIFNMLARHPAHKVVTIEGLAASMASVIAMAGDEIVMPENSMFMIHDATGGVSGSAEEIQSFGEAMVKMRANIAQAYSARSGRSLKEVGAMMNRTTWLDAKESKAKGFADRIEKPMAITAKIDVSKLNRVPASFGRLNSKENPMSTPAEVAAAQAIVDAAALVAGPKAKTPAELRAEVVAHGNEIRSMCALAGFPALADKLIADDTALPAVVAALTAAKETAATAAAAARGKGRSARANDEVSARLPVTDNADAGADLDPASVYAKWNSAGAR